MSALLAGSRCGTEGGGESPKIMVARLPFAGRGGPVQGVRMMAVGQDVAVEYLGELAVVVVNELPVGCTFGLGVVHRPEADPAIARKRSDAGGFLLPPVGQRVGLGMSGLVDDQEPAAVGVLYVDQVSLVRDLPVCWHTDREPGRVVIPGESPGKNPWPAAARCRGTRARRARRSRTARRGGAGMGGLRCQGESLVAWHGCWMAR